VGHLSTESRQAEVTPRGAVTIANAGLFDEAIREKASKGAIEIGRKNPLTAGAVLNLSRETPAVSLFLRKREQHIKNEGLERQQSTGVWHGGRLVTK
jgi:hypothetical protein